MPVKISLEVCLFDILTLFALSIILNLIMALIYLVLGLTVRKWSWLYLMSIESFLFALGGFLFSRQASWNPYITVLLPGTLQFISVALIMASVDRFAGKVRGFLWYMLPPLIITIVFFILIYIYDNRLARTVSSTILLIPCFLGIARTVARANPGGRYGMTYRVISIMTGFLGLAMIVRLVLFAFSSVNPFFSSYEFIWTYLLLSTIAATLIFAASTMLMTAVANERELEKALVKSEKLIEDRNRLLSILSHDLRGTIGLIDMMLTNALELEGPNLAPGLHEKLTRLQELGRSQSDMLSNLLLWLKSQKEDIKPKLTELAVDDILKNQSGFYTNMARNKDINVKMDLQGPLTAVADPEMLRTVLRNLVSNAVKFSPRNGSLEIKACRHEEYVLLSIKDNGEGFDQPQDKPESGTAGETGTGLGLQICVELLKKMRGRILIRSEKGKGTTAQVWLPSAVDRKAGETCHGD